MKNTKTKEENKIDQYLDNLIGSIDYSKFETCDSKFLKEIENARVTQCKYTIDSIITGIPKDKIAYIYTSHTRGFTPLEEMDILDIEVILNSAILTIFKLIKNKNNLYLKHHSDSLMCCQNIDEYNITQLTIYTAHTYSDELDRLITEKEKLIANLLEYNTPTVADPSELVQLQSSYQKKYKQSC